MLLYIVLVVAVAEEISGKRCLACLTRYGVVWVVSFIVASVDPAHQAMNR